MMIVLSVIVAKNYSVFSVCIIKSREVLIRGIIHYDLGCSHYYNALVYFSSKANGDLFRKAFQGSKTLDKVFGPFEKLIFKITGVKAYNQTWKQYALSLVLLNGFMIVVVYFIFRLQGVRH